MEVSPPSLLDPGWPLSASGGAADAWGALTTPRDSQPCLGGATACFCLSSAGLLRTRLPGWDSPR